MPEQQQADDASSSQEEELMDLKLPFPWKLHKLLQDSEDNDTTHIVSWQGDGRSFKIHKPKLFTSEVMPAYFSQTKFNSFRRQCYLYGFRLRRDGAFFHPEFQRDDIESCMALRRNQQDDRRKKRPLQDFLHELPAQKHLLEVPSLPPIPSLPPLPTSSSESDCSTPVEPKTDPSFELKIMQQAIFPDVLCSRPEALSENISSLAYYLFEKSQFFYPHFHPFLSLDGSYDDIPLDSLDQMFQTEEQKMEEIVVDE
eukprot:Nitzschia sp. Nitz4//scaffold6_size259037//216046//216810//NITZ4_001115-RA/size259037-processed-gene-0.92-mRNA-1//-1//CDS//3329557016//541//frame0